MDGVRLGSVARAIRIKKGLRQSDVARFARVSRDAVSRLERGRVADLRVDVVVRVFEALGGRLDLVPRWQGGNLDRLMKSRHAAMHVAEGEAPGEEVSAVGARV
ncbi:MAG TPA: helix-turn-helix transcriptional regulator [Candidatus Limnocylindrales bacterium]|jgi:transcriptional regulator with XRE-family HTH domain|nr:helix-turn-helix transcriptional regulator [Candidatus Limnocylindrales bacterium]